jgi:septal ring factor EnvC (AmiA/AmiB activator)
MSIINSLFLPISHSLLYSLLSVSFSPYISQTEKEGVETGLQLLRSRSDAAVQAVSTTETKIAQMSEETEKGTEKVRNLEKEKKEVQQRVKDMQTQGKKCQDEEAGIQTRLVTLLSLYLSLYLSLPLTFFLPLTRSHSRLLFLIFLSHSLVSERLSRPWRRLELP